MKRIGQFFKRLAMVAVVTATLTGIVVALDALLSPEGPDRPRRREGKDAV